MAKEQSELNVRDRVDIIEPRKWAVIFWNDDFTTMDFVVKVLTEVFLKTPQDAERIMMTIHKEGQGIVGTYSYDIAISRKKIADRMSRQEEFPLKITLKEV